MVIKLIIPLISIALFSSKISTAQNIFASTIKLGPFSLDMKNTAVDKICGKKTSASELKKASEDYEKMIEVIVNGIKYNVDFYIATDGNGKEDGTYNVTRIKCSDSRMKTKSGITIGMDKFSVLKKLDEMNVGFDFYKNFKYNNEGNPTTKFIEYIKIYDTKAAKTLTLNIENGKVSSYELYYDEGC